MDAKYLDDGVYVQQVSNGGIVVTTGSHDLADADNTVFLERTVAEALAKYITDTYEQR